MPPDLDIAPLRPEEDGEALALDRKMLQGLRFPLSFERSTFRRRAESFDDHVILRGRRDGHLVGLVAVGFKDTEWLGATHRTAFYFDLRVDPDLRRQGVGRAMADAILEVARPRSSLGYSYVVDDNRATRAMAQVYGFPPTGTYAYLVYPTFKGLPPAHLPRAATLDEVHERLLAHERFDFYTDPRRGGRLDGHVGSWLLEADGEVAGCSAWDNSPVLAEVVQRLPLGLRLARRARVGPVRRWIPPIPGPGERLRSWYLFDFCATTPEAGRSLLRHVARAAATAGIDYCYVIGQPDEPLLAALRTDLPAAFAPLLRYRLYCGTPEGDFRPVPRVYVDIRDV